ncbi:hypothetical protein EDC96DRAFT_206430 [Choanephora cucurbitarum]|nr:hypothetical protein EDC96DRAFT_206430 [Choanephora cucurbitarum]
MSIAVRNKLSRILERRTIPSINLDIGLHLAPITLQNAISRLVCDSSNIICFLSNQWVIVFHSNTKLLIFWPLHMLCYGSSLMSYHVTSNQVASSAPLLDQGKPFIHVAWQKMLVYVLRGNIACYRPPFRLLLTFQIPVAANAVEEVAEVAEEEVAVANAVEEVVVANAVEEVAANAVEEVAAVAEENDQPRTCLGPRKGNRQCRRNLKPSSGIFCHSHTSCKEDMEELNNWNPWINRNLPIYVQIIVMRKLKDPYTVDPKDRDRGYIYVFTSKMKNYDSTEEYAFVKIGMSNDNVRRLREHKKKCDPDPENYMSFPKLPRGLDREQHRQYKCPRMSLVEKVIHLELRPWQHTPEEACTCETKHREWFRVPRKKCPINGPVSLQEAIIEHVQPVINHWIRYAYHIANEEYPILRPNN